MSHIIKLIALQHTHLPATIQRSCGKFSCGSLIVWLFSSKILLPLKLKKKLYGTFLWMGFNYLKAAEPLRRGCLLFLPLEAPGTHFLPRSSQKLLVLVLSTLEGWKAESNLEQSSGFWTRDPWIGSPAPQPLGYCLL